MSTDLDLHYLRRSQLRYLLVDAFEKLGMIKETIKNIPPEHIPFPKLQEKHFLEQRISEYRAELLRRTASPVRIFYSYSRSDESFVLELNEHLTRLKGGRSFKIFWDRNLPPGAEWQAETITELRDSDLVLLLISPDYLASRYCQQVELPEALRLNNCGLAVVSPIIVRACDWLDTQLAQLQVVSPGGKPLAEAGDREAALSEMAGTILQLV